MTLKLAPRNGGRSGSLPGIHGTIQIMSPTTQARRKKYMGVLGVSEIRGAAGSRKLTFKITVFHSSLTTQPKVDSLITEFHRNVSLFHGRIFTVNEGSYNPPSDALQSFDRCTLDKFRVTDPPKKGLLFYQNSGGDMVEHEEYWFRCELEFTQVRY